MTSITIITIVVVALLTIIIFGVTWLAYRSSIKLYEKEVKEGKHDAEIDKEYNAKKTKGGLVGIICSYVVLLGLLSAFVVGIVYKASGDNFHIDNKTALVIKTGSMSGFYDDKLAQKYETIGYDSALQFEVGDICVFEKVTSEDELVEGEVYGYKQKDIIITHRLVGSREGLYEFRGDNNPSSDRLLVEKERIVYHYVGKKVPAIGSFVLFAQSYFGLWSFIGVIGVFVASEIVYYRVDKINKNRNKEMRGPYAK